MKCIDYHRLVDKPCKKSECRKWIEYDEDLNCLYESIDKHGPLTLREVADRLGVSFVMIKQIEDKTLKKLKSFSEKVS